MKRVTKKLLDMIRIGSNKHNSIKQVCEFSERFEKELDIHIDERIRKYGKTIKGQVNRNV